MKTTFVSFSGLILALGLSSPAWAQLGHLGVGADVGGLAHANISATTNTTNDDAKVDTHSNTQAQENVQTSDSTNGKKMKKKDKVNADAQSDNSANVNGKKHHGDKLQAKSDTKSNLDSTANTHGDRASAGSSAKVSNSDRLAATRR